MSSHSHSIISVAGAGKTTYVVKEAADHPEKKIAILTYTINNETEIKKKFYENHGAIPKNVVIMTWFHFLLTECVRPYQNFMYSKHRIDSPVFVNGMSAQYARKENVEAYFLNQGKYIYSDKISEFSILCNQKSGGLVIDRLKKIYSDLFIDEIQDLAGYDLDLLELFLRSGVNLTLVGDNRQATYATNNSRKNKNVKGINIIDLLKKWHVEKLCDLEYQNESYRCNQTICDFASELFNEMPPMKSLNTTVTGHDGLFVVPSNKVSEYISIYAPQVLRYDIKTDCGNNFAINFGAAKGLTFDRVLIFPNGPITQYLKSGNKDKVMNSRAKFYVAITRARYSVAFVYSEKCGKENLAVWE